jgi:peroxiredoxin
MAMAAMLLAPDAIASADRAAAPNARRADPQIGAPLPDFEATTMDGAAFSLRQSLADHRAVVVIFLSTVCPYANYFARHLVELAEGFGPEGVLFLGVNSNNWETQDEVAAHSRERGFPFAMIKDDGHALADRLGADRTPEAYLIDAAGTLRYRGWVKSKQESPDLKRAIEAVLEGRKVPRPRTKAFGCAVDRY